MEKLEPLYYCTVDNFRNERLLAVTGERATVVEFATRVMLDNAVAWQQPSYPQFRVTVQVAR